MPILVACDCGRRFAAKEHLFGRQVSCPDCGHLFTVSTAGRHAIGGLFVTCSCGLAFHAPESMRGQLGRCRNCGEILQVSGPDPLGLVGIPTTADIGVLSAPMPSLPPADEDEIPWSALKRIGVFGGITLAVVVMITT